MNPSEAIAFLRRYNHWRRGGDMDQPQPYEIGQAIDAICDHVERMGRELPFSEQTGRQIWDANKRLKRELQQLKATLDDPAEVELAMIRGDIAIPHRVEFDGIRDTPAEP